MHTMNTNTPITTRLSATTFNPMLAILTDAKAGSRSAEQARYRALVLQTQARSVVPNCRGDRDLVVYEFTMPFADLLGMADLIANAVWGLPDIGVDPFDRDHIARMLLARAVIAVRQESVELAS